jgi:hypothetical protein
VTLLQICHILPSYSGGSDQEDHSSKPAWANSSRDPILKKPSQKRAGGVAQGVDPEFKPQHHKKKKKKNLSRALTTQKHKTTLLKMDKGLE